MSTENVERRFTPGTVEVRASGSQERIGGYASVFNRLSRNLGGFVEVVAPTAFNRSRGNDWPGVIARYNHSDDALLGTVAARTLSLAIDDTGLIYDVDPPKARADVLELVSRGDVRYSSFAFTLGAEGDEWGTSDQGYPMRTLHSVQLVDVAPVISPAYIDATAGLRSLARHFDADLEEVRSLAQDNALRKFFVRTDKHMTDKPKTLDPIAARVELMRRQPNFT